MRFCFPNMIPLRIALSLCSLLVVLLLPSHTIAQAGELSFFFDASCTEPSTALPKASLELSTCLVPIGAYGLVINAYPACPNGRSASMIMYKDTICAQSTKGFLQDKCFYYFATLPISSIMFTCDDPTSDPQPTSTSTATATRIAGVATSQATNGATTLKNSVSTTGGGSSPTSGGTESSGNFSPTSGGTATSGSSSPSASSTSASGLSMSDKIAIGVGVGVGVPTILIGLIGLMLRRG